MHTQVCAYVEARAQLEGAVFFSFPSLGSGDWRQVTRLESMYLQPLSHLAFSWCVTYVTLQLHPYFPALGKARCCVTETLETMGGPGRQASSGARASFAGGPSSPDKVSSVCSSDGYTIATLWERILPESPNQILWGFHIHSNQTDR